MNGLPIAVLAAALIASVAGPTETPAWLVSFGDLQHRLDDTGLRLLDARPRGEYDRGHIPGAVWVDAKAVEVMAAKPGVLTNREAWERWIRPLGIGPETDVLIYDANRQRDAARLWWLLSYLGVNRVGLINGNYPLWASKKRPVTTEVPSVEPKPFKVAFRADRHATRGEVLSAVSAKTATIVDARTDGEYAGTEKRAKRGGHVPTSCHLEWNTLVDKDGQFLDESALRTKLARAAVEPNEPVITYCQSGGRASVDAFVLERLGFKTQLLPRLVRLGNASDTPVKRENVPGPKK